MRKAIFLDRDGTLVQDPGYVHKVSDFLLHDGVIEGLRMLSDYVLLVVTNQSGIGRGLFSEQDMHKYNKHMQHALAQHKIKFEKIYFCSHAPGSGCDCRKPSIKFINEAVKEFGIDLMQSWVVGDHDTDIEMARKSCLSSVYLLTGHGRKHLADARKHQPDYIAGDFLQAAVFITSCEEDKIVKITELQKLVNRLRHENKKIVTLNGAFDILHKGHEIILSEAKKQGDILIVLVNSDSSVKANKGPARPLNSQDSRIKMLSSFPFVDYIAVFDEKTPLDMLKMIKPDVHVNGSEYGHECIEAPLVKKYGGRIHIVPLLKGFSSTKIINGK